MKRKEFICMPISIILMLVGIISSCSTERISIDNLTVEYTTTPLGIDVEIPRFTWQMQVQEDARGCYQTAYQIVVKNPSEEVVWNSEVVKSSSALAIKYGGSPLKPATKYDWTVRVWDQNNQEHAAGSWFETGLMDPSPDLTAWGGAQWIGGSDKDLVLFSQYQLIFRMKFAVAIQEGSTRAGFVYGANDMRLMDKNKNINQIENKKGESYIKLELDISGLDNNSNGLAKLNIYRVGYAWDDRADIPLESFSIKSSVINSGNKYDKHEFNISSAFGRIIISLDGVSDFFLKDENYQPAIMPFETYTEADGVAVNLNPFGLGGDYLPYGNLCDIGFSMDAGQKAAFSDLEILNDRKPNSRLFKEDLPGSYAGIFAGKLSVGSGSYLLDGGESGTFVVADPSRNSTPMLRTEFNAEKNISTARLYITARGIYEVYINGDRVGKDYYNPGLTQYNKTHMYQTYDVTELIKSGENAMGAMMAEGWWSGLLSFVPIWNHFGDRQSLAGQTCDIYYSDGSRETITTNDTDLEVFSTTGLLFIAAWIWEKSTMQQRKHAIEGWSNPGFDDSGWTKASVVPLEGYHIFRRGKRITWKNL